MAFELELGQEPGYGQKDRHEWFVSLDCDRSLTRPRRVDVLQALRTEQA